MCAAAAVDEQNPSDPILKKPSDSRSVEQGQMQPAVVVRSSWHQEMPGFPSSWTWDSERTMC